MKIQSCWKSRPRPPGSRPCWLQGVTARLAGVSQSRLKGFNTLWVDFVADKLWTNKIVYQKYSVWSESRCSTIFWKGATLLPQMNAGNLGKEIVCQDITFLSEPLRVWIWTDEINSTMSELNIFGKKIWQFNCCTVTVVADPARQWVEQSTCDVNPATEVPLKR